MADPQVVVDVFCGGGGAGRGYADAGFIVVGVDRSRSVLRTYPYPVFLGDWRDGLAYWLNLIPAVSLIHASPPCQAYSNATRASGDRSKHPDLIGEVRKALVRTGWPWAIENVPGAPLCADLRLCGTGFGLPVRRHRVIETSWVPDLQPPPCAHRPDDLMFKHKGERDYADAMGCYWMGNGLARQAIPPAYTAFIAEVFRDARGATRC